MEHIYNTGSSPMNVNNNLFSSEAMLYVKLFLPRSDYNRLKRIAEQSNATMEQLIVAAIKARYL